MGFSTFIEINNDYAHEIEGNKEIFVNQLINYLYTGTKKDILGISNISTFHRDGKKVYKIRKLMATTKAEGR